MTTSGTTTFTMEVDDIIEQALAPLGGEVISGVEAATARRVLNLLLIELQNKNIPLNKLDRVNVNLTLGVEEYVLDGSVSDVLEVTVDQGDVDIPLERWGAKDFHQIPNKYTRQRPTLYSTDRQRDNVILKFWPVPEKSYLAKLLVVKKVEDITASYQSLDLPTRYLPLIVKWLSYELAITRVGVDKDIIAMLKMRLDETMPDTFDEDRERVNYTISPGGISGR